MPKKNNKSSKRKNKKPSAPGPGHSKALTTTVPRNVPIMPDRFICDLVYNVQFLFDPTVAGPTTKQLIAGNSIFDPDISGVGVQPEGYDQLTAFYDKVRVFGSKLQTEIVGTGSGIGSFARFYQTPTRACICS